ncbi:hypothetical protein EO946_10685 [Bacillus spizizenii ATCC 6633 = JCM 2499]|uniref:hypothetical protein n=1 Tax=Bacillus spizizenii TaxID=96241 RepID=UPI00030B1561|nr:hypothetical protein [Bacillus spizizenii]MDR4201509.1 hypothetical protein [Bacillus spizizenii ATCC 6633 = JCM 2499]QCJ17296.1 hypothetical protein FA024_09165 [Bacillus subtilis]MBE0173732.1 hypothetical protein [Bacillus spizizenii]MCY8063996.1 hypothetical protein [Bacillus spizizenii]QCY17524.1 hypothetical protein EO946_10685 [Bacillus spizizenii ATCC 6633 = JCM 2499]
MGMIVYLVMQISKVELYLPEFYIFGQNPVTFHWNFIGIKTGFKKATKFGLPRYTLFCWQFSQ